MYLYLSIRSSSDKISVDIIDSDAVDRGAVNLKQLEEGVLSNVKDTHLSSPPTTDQSLPRAGIAQRCRTTIMAHEV